MERRCFGWSIAWTTALFMQFVPSDIFIGVAQPKAHIPKVMASMQ